MFEAVEIEINSHCNKACSYCPNSLFERIEKGAIEEALFDLILAQLVEMNFKGRISYSFFNEPLLNKNLIRFVEKTRKYLPNSFIELYTNGSLLNLKKIEDLILSGVDLFTITRHEDVVGDDLEIVLNSLDSESRSKINYKKYQQIQLTNRGGVLPHLGNNEKTILRQCRIPEKMISITVEGNVLPCFEDFFQKNSMGNIKNNHLKDIWNSQAYIDFRKDLNRGFRHKYNACKDCSRLEVL